MIYDFIVVGAGTAGAVVASRLSEDSTCQVALLEAGNAQHPFTPIPFATPFIQGSPQDWAFTGSAGKGAKGFSGDFKGRMGCPRGKCLGGTSCLNYLAYVRGHPGDFDQWAKDGAEGWNYASVLPLFKKSERLHSSPDIAVDDHAHGTNGPLAVSVRQPVMKAASLFCNAAQKLGHTHADYNGSDRGGAKGCVSLHQTTMHAGFRMDSYSAFLKPVAESRTNLKIITDAMVNRIALDGKSARGVECVIEGKKQIVQARKEVILCSGAIQSPQLLQLSGIGPKALLSSCGIECIADAPHVGKGLKDHLLVLMVYSAPGIGVSMMSAGPALGPDALRQNPTQVFDKGPLPADPSQDDQLPDELKQLKSLAEQLVGEYMKTGTGIPASTLYDASAFYSSGLGDHHTHDVQVSMMCSSFNRDAWEGIFHIDCSKYYDDPATALGPMSENIAFMASNVQPHSEGNVQIQSNDPLKAPNIDFAYLTDHHDVEVMKNAMRRSHEIAAKMDGVGTLYVPADLAKKHNYKGELTDALLEDWIYHYAQTYYHAACTCRMGSVVDSKLKVMGISNLRVADASVMPNIVSGNTQAACYMIGEKAAAMIQDEYKMVLNDATSSASLHCPCALA